MKETYIPLRKDTLYLRHSEIKPGCPALLFVHGLGDSGLAFEDIFNRENFSKFNILIPDLIGYGRSSDSDDYSFESHVNRLWNVIDYMEKQSNVPIDNIVVVSHSMGGIIAALLCESDRKGVIKKSVMVEGSITQFGSFVSYKVKEVNEQGRFPEWLDKVFISEAILNRLLKKYPSCGHYYASLLFCRRQAFLENALEIGKFRLALPGKWKNRAGEIYTNLKIPRVYCYGEDSMCPETKEFLKERELDYKVFDTGCHFVMSDKKDDFYKFLYEYI